MTDKDIPTHVGLPVAGYQPQTSAAVSIVNEHKEWEERLLRAIEILKEGEVHKCDNRWLAIATNHFEQGFMALNRAVFQPQRIKLPEEKRGDDYFWPDETDERGV